MTPQPTTHCATSRLPCVPTFGWFSQRSSHLDCTSDSSILCSHNSLSVESNTKSNHIKFYSFGGIQIRVDRSFKRPSESHYLPCLKYCMANSIMECLSELYSDLSDLVDLTLPVLGRISPVIGPSGSTFSKLPMEAAFTMVAGRADATAWGSWSLKIANLNSTYFTLNFSFIFSGKFSTVTWT